MRPVPGRQTVLVSRVSRGPRGKRNKKKTTSRADLTLVASAPETCDCPHCSDEDFDPAQMFGELLDSVAILADCDNALEAELVGAAFVAAVTIAGDELVPAFIQEFIPQVEARADTGGLALLLAIDSVASGVEEQVAATASAAAARLVAAGVPTPRWAGELAEPVQVDECVRLHHTHQTMSVLVVSLRRADHRYAFMVTVDEENCGAAADILLADAEQLPEALDDIRAGARAEGVHLKTQTVDPAEMRWYIEDALDARAVHDEDGVADTASMLFDEDDVEAPPYPALALLVRARLAALPPASKPAGARGHAEDDSHQVILLDASTAMLSGARGGQRGFGGPRFGRPAPAKLPAKRKKSDGPAPIYQIKVGLRDARPPIWRRLLLPADMSLAGLHDVIQVAFGWHGGHMHVFETLYGDFGCADRELGHRAEAPVTLEQVAAQVKDKIRYTYDFGDDWAHEIVVEKVLDRDPELSYPRCTGGRRAAPPDDCGGIWGYQELVEVLADPKHPEHEERLEWLELDDASQFDPAAFDVAEVNRGLAELS
jgi:hypothetical protein